MGFLQSPSPPQLHLYSQELQLKLYQAFIFSIPILFSIILFLLFYLFYLKKRSSAVASSSATLPESLNQTTLIGSSSAGAFKEILREKLPMILFDEHSRAKETVCCVCLGEFKIKEELHQLPECKHFYHFDCIHHWLYSNSTCPLCRCSVIITAKSSNSEPLGFGNDQVSLDNENLNRSSRVVYVLQQEQLSVTDLSVDICTRDQQTVFSEGSSRSADSVGNEGGLSLQVESVVLTIQTHGT